MGEHIFVLIFDKNRGGYRRELPQIRPRKKRAAPLAFQVARQRRKRTISSWRISLHPVARGLPYRRVDGIEHFTHRIANLARRAHGFIFRTLVIARRFSDFSEMMLKAVFDRSRRRSNRTHRCRIEAARFACGICPCIEGGNRAEPLDSRYRRAPLPSMQRTA